MKTTSALVTALANANSITGNPDAPLLTPAAVNTILASILGDVPVVAVKTLTGAGAAKVLAETVGAGATDADYVLADLGKITSVTRVEVLDITTHYTFIWAPGVGTAKAVKIANDGAQTLLGANGITVSGAVVTLGSSVLTNAATCVVTITGK
jgi:hypothetical protein